MEKIISNQFYGFSLISEKQKWIFKHNIAKVLGRKNFTQLHK